MKDKGSDDNRPSHASRARSLSRRRIVGRQSDRLGSPVRPRLPAPGCRPFARTAHPSPLVLQGVLRTACPLRRHPIHALAPSRGEYRSRRSQGRRRPKPPHRRPTSTPPTTTLDRRRAHLPPRSNKLRVFRHVPSRAAPFAQLDTTPPQRLSAAHEQPENAALFKPAPTGPGKDVLNIVLVEVGCRPADVRQGGVRRHERMIDVHAHSPMTNSSVTLRLRVAILGSEMWSDDLRRLIEREPRPHHVRHHRDDRDRRPGARHRLRGPRRHPRLGGPLLLRGGGPRDRPPRARTERRGSWW